MSGATHDAPTVFQFPDPASRSWRWMRDGLRTLYLGQGIPPDVLDPSLDTVGEIYKLVRDGGGFPQIAPGASGDEIVMAVEMWVRDITIKLLTHIAVREFELRQAGLRE